MSPDRESSVSKRNYRWTMLLWPLLGLCVVGCGTTKSYTATEQLLMSDAVDATVAKIDFSPLADQRVYLDVSYLKTQKSPFLIDSDYVISSIRQQLVGAGVQLVEAREDADLIAEARIGALGMDGHNVTYGIPASNTLASASSVFANAPIIPAIPEVSLARHEAKSGAAKIAVFAYERESRQPFWQSGVSKSSSSARDTWVLGVGPWQRGTIYEGTRFAGSKLATAPLLDAPNPEDYSDSNFRQSDAFAAYHQSRVFQSPVHQDANEDAPESLVVTASAEEAKPLPKDGQTGDSAGE